MRKWEKEGVLITDVKPSIYPYQQVFDTPAGGLKKRNGFIALVKLEALGQPGGVIPHEETTPKPVEDRLRLMEACGANLSQVFTLYADPSGEIDEQFNEVWDSAPRREFRDDYGVLHRFWQIDDKKVIAEVARRMSDKSLLIADGHHRYKTALMYRDSMRERFPAYTERSPFEYTMLYLTPIEGEGLLIHPTHRLVRPREPFDLNDFYAKLKEYFAINVFSFDNAGDEKGAREDFFKALDKRSPDRYTFGLYIGNEKRYIQLIFKKDVDVKELLMGYPEDLQELDVTLLDGFILNKLLKVDQEGVELSKSRYEALEAVHEGKHKLAFLLHPPSIQQVKRVVDAGELMPRKTTFFYPKVATGMIFYKIAPDEEVALV